jgi:protein-L-isoaspartate(D-aspartate) O-methyltransferase
MVERDLRGRGIRDPRVLEAMNGVPRHLFVPKSHRREAYADSPLPIGEGQTISQPYIVALMTELLALSGHEKVLEIGAGSGYQAAVLARLAKEVYTIEVVPALAARAAETLKRLGYPNVAVKSGDGFFGWPENAPFDAILVTAAAEIIADPLWAQLVEGGTLVMPLGKQKQTQKLVRVKKVNGKRRIETITDVLFVPMTGRVRGEGR